MSDVADIAESLLDEVVAAKGGERRDGQVEMARAVADALDRGEHLLVEAGTGTGKSFGYLVPAIAAGRPVVVATATKSLQDQLAGKDLPEVASALGDRVVTWAVVKGRGSYLCRSRLDDRLGELGITDQASLFDAATLPEELGRVVAWSEETTTGDRDEAPFPVEDWGAYTVGGMECPGRDQCPRGEDCFAFAALDRAADADVVVVNHHLYAAHLSTEGTLLPPHEALVVDEAHRLEDTMAAALGIDLAGWRVMQLTRAMGGIEAAVDGAPALRRRLAALARDLDRGLASSPVGRFDDLTALPVAEPIEGLATAVGELAAKLRALRSDRPGVVGSRARSLRLAGHLVGDLAALADPPEDVVAWIEGGRRPALRAALVDVAALLRDRLYGEVTVVGTSATLSLGGSLVPTARALGLGDADHPVRLERLSSPFDYARQTRLFVDGSLPDPRTDAWAEAVGDTTLQLVEAAGGRALVLCTSRRMVDRLSERLIGLGEHRILVQGELGAQALAREFAADETSVLVATMGFWEGLDVPGRSLQLVVIDRLPFPRPDDPLWAARREAAERAGRSAFVDVDLPRAATLLAQGAGRLIRTGTDHGVVAILDPRIVRARYGRSVLAGLPPMPVVGDLSEAQAFLAAIR